MVANIHSFFGYTLIGIFIQIVGEENGILFKKSHHWCLKVGGVEFVHIGDISVPLIEGVPVVND